MNKIQRIVFTMACLLTSLGGYSYKIVSMGSYPGDKCTVTATYNSNIVIAGTTDIPASTSNNVTIHISNITPGYYLEKIEYEYVTDLGQAQAPRRASGPGIQTTKETISHNSSHTTHYAGDYGLAMPASDIIITAIFTPCTPITGATLHWDSNSSSINITYDHALHTANVYLGSSDLTVNADYTITTNKQTNVGSITPTITGVGTYCGTINNQTISITTKTLNIAAVEGQSKVYGASDPVFTYTYSGLCSGDQITGALGRAAGENVGSYAINIGGLTAGSNYNIAFTSKNFTINPKDLSAVALTISLDHDFFNDNDGEQKAQISTIKYGNTTLNSGSDYNSTFTYGTGKYGFADNTTPDIYPITVTFKGNYTGTKTVDYQIRPQLNLTDQAARWMTYYEATYNMEVIDGFEAYTIREVTASSVTLEQRVFIRANNTPMLLYRSGDTKQFNLPLLKPTDSRVTSSQDATTGWKLSDEYKICTSNMDLPGAIPSGKEIWILVDDHFMRTKSGTLIVGRCYIERSNSSYTSPMLSIGRKTTGIEEETIKDFDLNGVWYTLDGRKIQGIPAQKGIYIKNGKKIIIK